MLNHYVISTEFRHDDISPTESHEQQSELKGWIQQKKSGTKVGFNCICA